MRTLACFHVVKPCLWNSDYEWKISICRQFPNSISSHVCTRLRCYIVAYKHCDLFGWETSYFPWRNQQKTLKNSLKIRVFTVRRKKIKFKKCARAILDSDNKMPSCCQPQNVQTWQPPLMQWVQTFAKLIFATGFHKATLCKFDFSSSVYSSKYYGMNR